MKSPVARLRRYARRTGSNLVLEVLDFARKRHKADERKDKTPFINHTVGATLILILAGIRNEVILAADVLHDIVEKEKATLKEIERKFGQEVALLVDRVSQRLNETLEDYYERISGDIRTILIKASDHLHNLKTAINVLSLQELDDIVMKGEHHVIPMIRKAQTDYPEYREILVELEDRITEKLDEVKAYLVKVRAIDRLIDVLSEVEIPEPEIALPTDSERREV